MPPKKMTANPLAPLRYRPGKPVGADEPSSSEESESEEDEEEEEAQRHQAARASAPKATSFPKINAGLSKEELERRRQEAIAARAREADLASKAEDGFETASESDEEEGSEDDDSDEEESSEDEAPQRKFIAPTFIKKSQRNQAAAPEKTAEEIAAEEERRRQEKADEMLQAQLEKDAAERAAGRRAWDEDDDAIQEDVDDTDGLDPEAERAAWKLRELKRIKREREAIEEAEKEREEIERRRNLSAAERDAEDKAFIEAQKADKEGSKGQMGFMQKYFHKGAFFQGEGGEAEEAAKRRDIMGARYADDAANRELLPQYMQIRDMTKLGRKGRTKYRDMKSEDTGRWGDFGPDMRGPGGGAGGAGDRYRNDQEGPSGANASAVGERRRRDDERQGGGRDEKRPRFDR